MGRGLAYRRVQVRSAKHRVMQLFRWLWDAGTQQYRCWGPESNLYVWQPSDQMVGRFTSTHFKPCSCPFCGNPRRHFGAKTRQELQAKLSESEQVEEAHSKNVQGKRY